MSTLLSRVAHLFLAALFLLTLKPDESFARQAETLFNGSISHGGFGGPVVRVDRVAGTTAAWVGARGGWIINFTDDRAISIGGGGQILASEHLSASPGLENNDLFYAMTGYGGLVLEYTSLSYRLVHLTATSLIGGGTLMLRDRHFDEVSDDIDPYFVFEPGLHLELNVTHFFRIAAGLSYRLTSGIGSFGFSDSDFSGPGGIITLKFGAF